MGLNKQSGCKVPDLSTLEAALIEESNCGWCVSCGDFTAECVETDVEEGICPVCGQASIYGAEELLLRSWVRVDSDLGEGDADITGDDDDDSWVE